jgi:hypothetical protein
MEIIIESINEVDDEDRNQMKLELEKLIPQLSSNLNLHLLQSIFIPQDFGRTVTNFQEAHGLEVGYTNYEKGLAAAKTIKYIHEGHVKIAIFIQQRVFLALFSPETSQFAINIIHHELCHVHDEYNQIKMIKFAEEMEKHEVSYLENVLLSHSIIVWEEYFAPRMSANSLPKDSDLYVPYLLELISYTEANVKEKINSYRNHGNVPQLFVEIQELTNPLLKIAATVLGNVHGLRLENNKIMEIIDSAIKDTFFYPIWTNLLPSLLKLYDNYPNWKSINVLNELNNLVLQTWNELGIYPKDEGDQAYINVP